MLNNPVYISNNKESIVTTIEKHLLIYDMDCALNTYKNIYNEVTDVNISILSLMVFLNYLKYCVEKMINIK